MKYQVLFSLKNNEKVFINVACCSCDWPFQGLIIPDIPSHLEIAPLKEVLVT